MFTSIVLGQDNDTAATSCFRVYSSCQSCYGDEFRDKFNCQRESSIAKWMNSFANRTNSFANRMKSIAKRTNSITKTCMFFTIIQFLKEVVWLPLQTQKPALQDDIVLGSMLNRLISAANGGNWQFTQCKIH